MVTKNLGFSKKPLPHRGNSKKVFVTGATGFIGLHCIHQLNDRRLV
jgi:FlaA1/EpsC-like NDP-sugar epimerase